RGGLLAEVVSSGDLCSRRACFVRGVAGGLAHSLERMVRLGRCLVALDEVLVLMVGDAEEFMIVGDVVVGESGKDLLGLVEFGCVVPAGEGAADEGVEFVCHGGVVDTGWESLGSGRGVWVGGARHGWDEFSVQSGKRDDAGGARAIG